MNFKIFESYLPIGLDFFENRDRFCYLETQQPLFMS